MRNFITLTQEDIDAKLAESLHSRELELLSYDFERENHETAIASLGDIGWDDTTIPYRGLTRDTMIVRAQTDGKDSEFIQQVADLLSLEKHKSELEAVKVETAKSERHYDSILVSLPEERREVAIAALKEKNQAEEAIRLSKK